MVDTLLQYFLFLAEVITIVLAVFILFAGLIALSRRARDKLETGEIEIKRLNDKYDDLHDLLSQSILPKALYKKFRKTQESEAKDKDKHHKTASTRKRLFVLDFEGDIRASGVEALREEVTAVLMVAKPEDEVLLRLESAGGMVHAYGLAAAQLARIREQHIPLTCSIDKVAASGGYMMAVVANRILAAPFAMVGSIGVLTQLPNFNKLLKKNNIDFEQLSAGEYKRTLTLFGENTDKGRQKMQEELEEIHQHFKIFIKEHRPELDMNSVATGEHWIGKRAKELGLVDTILTSDDYLLEARKITDLYSVHYHVKQSLSDKITSLVQGVAKTFVQFLHG